MPLTGATEDDSDVLARSSGAEVRDRRGTADALNPDVLDPCDVGCNVLGGDDHLRGEGLVVTVAGAVEVCVKPDRVLVGGCGLQGLPRRPGALEGRAPSEIDRVPGGLSPSPRSGRRRSSQTPSDGRTPPAHPSR